VRLGVWVDTKDCPDSATVSSELDWSMDEDVSFGETQIGRDSCRGIEKQGISLVTSMVKSANERVFASEWFCSVEGWSAWKNAWAD
jgi:hypothetical protein